MKRLKGIYKSIALAALLLGGSGVAEAQKYHCERDTAEAMSLIREFYNPGSKPGEVCGQIAVRMVERPYAAVTRNDSTGMAEIRLDGFDGLTFVNMVAALAKGAVNPGYIRPVDLQEILESFTFRRGVPNGFSSRMLYGADWGLDNKARGNLKELTEDYSDRYKTKSLQWVSHHRDQFAALRDSANFEQQKVLEFGYRTFKIPHIKREAAGYKDVGEDMKVGDIVMLLTPDPEMDIHEIGFVVKREDGFHMVHVSPESGKVVEESDPIDRYMKRNAKKVYGWRWFRVL